ncbi:Uncharacterised protein [Listeria monocytogenes]|nr:Uncharacterised protein [Listeria monocytogenes]
MEAASLAPLAATVKIVLNLTFEAVIEPTIIKPSILEVLVTILIPPDSYNFLINPAPTE